MLTEQGCPLKLIVLSFLFVVVPFVSADNIKSCSDLKEQCTFVLFDETNNSYSIINKARSQQQFSPYSSFKIANTLIALDTGVVESLAQELTFSRKSYPIQKWWPVRWYKSSLKVRQAFQFSAVPIYQTLAKRIGEGRMQNYLNEFCYGNKDISSGIDSFWLNESLRISAFEQIEFLRKLNRQKFDLKPSTYSKFLKVMLVEQNQDYRLYAKTGGGPLSSESAIGWYVGFVKKGSDTYYFALNISGPSFNAIKDKRKQLVDYHLKSAGVI